MKGFLKDIFNGVAEIFGIGYSDALKPFTNELTEEKNYQKQTAENTAELNKTLEKTAEQKAEMLKALNDWQKNRMKDLER